MVCLSLHGTTKLINRLSDDHDVDVLFWSDHFSDAVKVIYNKQSQVLFNFNINLLEEFSTNEEYFDKR